MPKILIFNPMDLRWMNNVANYFVLRCRIFGLKIRRYKSILSVTTITNSIKTLTPPSSPTVPSIDTTNCKTQSDLSSWLVTPSSKKKKKKKKFFSLLRNNFLQKLNCTRLKRLPLQDCELCQSAELLQNKKSKILSIPDVLYTQPLILKFN